MSSITTTTGLSELELKRQAVLASLKRNRSRSQSPLPSSAAPSAPTIGAACDDELIEAILDLRSIGYSFDRIVSESGVKREFLEGFYKELNFPVPSVPIVATPVPKEYQNSSDKVQFGVSKKSRPSFQNKVYRREIESPEWLKNLVIDLQSSDEEESDEEESDEEDSDERGEDDVKGYPTDNDPSEALASIEIAHAADVSSISKRKLEALSLEGVRSKKKCMNDKINSLSKELTESGKISKNVKQEIERREESLKVTEQKLERLVKQIEELKQMKESDLEIITELKSHSMKHQMLKDSLAELLIEIDTIEKQEVNLLKIETEKKALKEKLLKQMKNKEEEKVEVPNENESIEPTEPLNESEEEFVSNETVHKIPKTHKSTFTPYESLGLRKKANTSKIEDKTLCPIELLNGSCTEKACEFQHLN